MVSPVEIGVYTVVFTTAIISSITFLVASRRFVKGEFKDFINWVISASLSFLFGSVLNLFSVVFYNTAYGQTFLVLAGFAFVVMGACFIRAAFMLHDLSKVFGFAWLEDDFKKLRVSHTKKPKKHH